MNEARARLSDQQLKELMADQKAWVRTYATACGVPPEAAPPVPPVSASVKACFKRAGEARTAYVRSYGLQVSTAPSPAPTPIARDRLGPGFDCSKATAPLALMICADPELSRIDLAFNQAYWALYQQRNDADHQQLKEEDVRFLDSVQDRCGVPRSGVLPTETWHSRSCVKDAYQQQRALWIGRLSGAAYEEATRPLGVHVASERKLRQLGVLSAPVIPEGVYAAGTRRAIVAWQQSHGNPLTGLLGDADAIALQREDQAEMEPPFKEATRRDDSAPEPQSTPRPPGTVEESSAGHRLCDQQ